MTLLKGNYKLQKTVTKNKPTAEEKLEILLEKKAHKKDVEWRRWRGPLVQIGILKSISKFLKVGLRTLLMKKQQFPV